MIPDIYLDTIKSQNREINELGDVLEAKDNTLALLKQKAKESQL